MANIMTSRGNQHKPLPPDVELYPVVFYYWKMGLNDKEIVKHAIEHFDQSRYGLSLRSLERRRKKWNLLGTRQQQQTFETIAPFIQEIKERFPNMGARALVTILRQEYLLKVPERVVNAYLRLTEPEAVRFRMHKRFRRKRFWAAGVMDIWTCDQHDKWKRFGLWLHICLDPYCGRIIWLKIWWSNRNPNLIGSYYFQAGRKNKGVPLVTQSDRGWEMYVVANAHTNIRHRLDPSLQGTLQHRWCFNKSNVKPEAAWSQLRRQFTPGFEEILDYGLNNGLYDPNNSLEKLVFRWLAIPWLQAELDNWVNRYNTSPRRADKHKILPQGIPDLINAKPHLYHSKDFKIHVADDLFDEMEAKWAPSDLPIFQLVPPAFDQQISTLYDRIGKPTVSSKTFWDIYVQLLNSFQDLVDVPQISQALEMADNGLEEQVPLIEGLRDLRFGDSAVGDLGYTYYGGLQDPAPKDQSTPTSDSEAEEVEEDLREYAEFTDTSA